MGVVMKRKGNRFILIRRIFFVIALIILILVGSLYLFIKSNYFSNYEENIVEKFDIEDIITKIVDYSNNQVDVNFLDWAHKSMRAVSASVPGEKVKGQELPPSVTIDDLM